jgi:hypothetical protein
MLRGFRAFASFSSNRSEVSRRLLRQKLARWKGRCSASATSEQRFRANDAQHPARATSSSPHHVERQFLRTAGTIRQARARAASSEICVRIDLKPTNRLRFDARRPATARRWDRRRAAETAPPVSTLRLAHGCS